MLLREPTIADVDSLAELGKTTFMETFGHMYAEADSQHFIDRVHSPNGIAEELANPKLEFQVAEFDSSLVGYCKIGALSVPVSKPLPGAMELRQLFVLAKYQNRQIGTKLADWAMARFKEHACPEVYVSVWSENFGAQRFYERYGFAKFEEYQYMVGQHADHEFIMRAS